MSTGIASEVGGIAGRTGMKGTSSTPGGRGSPCSVVTWGAGGVPGGGGGVSGGGGGGDDGKGGGVEGKGGWYGGQGGHSGISVKLLLASEK